jgi:hypothetical protein
VISLPYLFRLPLNGCLVPVPLLHEVLVFVVERGHAVLQLTERAGVRVGEVLALLVVPVKYKASGELES